MTPEFNESKTAQAAALLLRLRGGRMSYMKLIKMLYLADREALLKLGRPVTFDRYVSMDRGPVLSRTLELIREEPRPGSASAWRQCIGQPDDRYEVELIDDCGTDLLSDAEEAVLQGVFDEYGDRDRWTMVDLVHRLPEWQDPHGSAIPIQYRDILLAGGLTDVEVAGIEEELEELAAAERML